jgi:nitric oxide reductase subunit B
MRLPGDLTLIIGGVLPFLWICWLGVRYRVKPSIHELPQGVLFTEIVERVPVGAGERDS